LKVAVVFFVFFFPCSLACWLFPAAGWHSVRRIVSFFLIPSSDEYTSLLAFIFAIDEINRNPSILPNVTLGYHAYDACGDSNKAIKDTLQILSGNQREAPNYSCQERLAMRDCFFAPSVSEITLLPFFFFFLSPSLIYGASNTELSDRKLYPYFFRTVQDDNVYYQAIVILLKYFGSNWVGIITSDDVTREKEIEELSQVITSHGICIEFSIKLSRNNDQNLDIVKKATSQIFILCGEGSVSTPKIIKADPLIFQNITFIICPSSILGTIIQETHILFVNGSLSFILSPENIPGFHSFLSSVNTSNRPRDALLEDLWLVYLQCISPNRKKTKHFEIMYGFTANKCTEEKSFSDIEFISKHIKAYGVYTAVHVLAQALHRMQEDSNRNYHEWNQGKNVFKNKVIFPLHLHNHWPVRCSEEYRVYRPWKEGQCMHVSLPQSRCSERCLLGYRKAPREGYHACCYDCIPCSEGEISNETGNVSDVNNCLKCPDDEWPDQRRIICIPKTYEFLSYEHDVMTVLFSFISILFSFLTIFILIIFILFMKSPVVRANNQNLSFLLLVSIMLSFLCVFLFLGRPVDITCKLRQTTFGTIYSVALSSVLAKTIIVCIAFKATKPGSIWRKWVGVRTSHYVVTICSSIQVVINVIWLSLCPPFQEYDKFSYPGKIIIQCNEGSVTAFYSVLGYMGILAAVSFLLAFMVRTLPDSFNEAKYITFSMLVFCSVWIAMIPAYLSTKGKDMVAVEVFAILASSAGLLSCIYFPKCYILLMKPEMNNRKQLLGKL
uniref:G-protein coupled receptors family 3 profile domain-containing protein n=1 Tax=Leptobrachium leishanense TaxID=445787 RepID=A0A8C5W6I0_9ANUR